MAKTVMAPMGRGAACALECGEGVLLSGIIYTARDAAHKRLVDLASSGQKLPFDIENAIIYYTGPTPGKPGQAIGSVGPTSSYRMDAYAPELIRLGQTGMIGKGRRSPEVVAAMREFGAVYFGAIGGAGALMARCVKSSKVIAFEDLGTEAIRELVVKDMPLTVIIDSEGHDYYKLGRQRYLRSEERIRGCSL